MTVQLRRIHPDGRETHLDTTDRVDLRRWLQNPYYPFELDNIGFIIDHTLTSNGHLALTFHNSLWILPPTEEHTLHRYL